MVTLKDIAAKTGVNVSTVSRALNDSPEISEKKKAYIQKIARKLNYIPNISAQSLVGKKSKSIGLILPEIRSNYYAQIANNIGSELRKHKYSMIISLTDFASGEESHALEVLSSRGVDGILVTSFLHTKIEERLKHIRTAHRIPIVVVDSFIPCKSFDRVDIDSYTGILKALSYFKESGKLNIGFIGDQHTRESRYPSFKKALARVNLPLRSEYVAIGKERFEEGGYQRMNEMIQSKSLPDAIFSSYDDMAIGTLRAMYEVGMSPAKDIPVIGYDNIRVSSYIYESLSTINAPLKELSRKSVEILFKRIHGTEFPVERVSLSTELILRQTT